ncbi:uncharacterized protein A1O9_00569 [Exophiala aquamarina CBS 119918]|uniref:Uncharacterized protein n=1 Tax=Exophiala aquamarina CBS 119918 TaxID=1182545 RepID=A0A072PRU1_9EURO|nr:uncharacterized protein A1O9_00569 [Exophiala aquamarina CBS 119918]KEF62596.1 hypothetical protein A1O9_00569 [Exophiala aquamarina CBS 119918]
MSSSLLQVPFKPVPDRRHSVNNNTGSPQSPVISRKGSASSITSHKSEPGWMSAMNGIDRSRTGSTASQTSHLSTKSSSGGFSKLFGKSKHDEKQKKKGKKKDLDQIVITSRHAAAVRTKLALDPKLKKASHKDQQPVVTGTQSSAHLTAQEQEIRRPHSGPPSLRHAAKSNKADMPFLTRIISGDEADEPDEWERLREEWRTRKIPGVEMLQVVEGETLDGSTASSSGTATPEDRDVLTSCYKSDINLPPTKLIESEGVRLVTVNNLSSDTELARPSTQRHNTPIGGRWKKDRAGVWKR